VNWLQSLIYGLVSGMTEFLPVSSDAHKTLCLTIMGEPEPGSWISLSVKLGALLAVFSVCGSLIGRLIRERKIALTPRHSRKRRPDSRSVMDYRFLRVAALPLLLSLLLSGFAYGITKELWLLAISLLINGVLLYLP